MRRITALVLLLALGACAEDPDPADGGFFSGVSGIASGSYAARTEAEVQATEEARARNEALRAEQSSLAAQISATEAELAQAKLVLLRQRDANPNMDAATRSRVNSVLLAEPSAGSDAARLAELQEILSETRALSSDLAQLAG